MTFQIRGTPNCEQRESIIHSAKYEDLAVPRTATEQIGSLKHEPGAAAEVGIVAVCELHDSSTEVIVNCRTQALAQACAVCSPKPGSMSEMAIFHQPLRVGLLFDA